MLAEQLTRFELFHGLPAPAAETVAKLFKDERLAPGSVIFEEGDSGDRLYLIGEGTVRITQKLGNAAEEALAFLKAGTLSFSGSVEAATSEKSSSIWFS